MSACAPVCPLKVLAELGLPCLPAGVQPGGLKEHQQHRPRAGWEPMAVPFQDVHIEGRAGDHRLSLWEKGVRPVGALGLSWQ